MPYVSRLAMIMVSSAPLATATSAMALNSQSGTPTPVAATTSSSGPDDSDSSSGGRAVALATPTSDVEDARGDQRAEERCGIDLARIADLLGDVRRRLEADERVVGDDRAAQDRQRRRRAVGELGDPADVAAPAADHDRHRDDDDQQAGELDHRHHDVALDRLADAARVEARDEGQEHDRGRHGGTSTNVAR